MYYISACICFLPLINSWLLADPIWKNCLLLFSLVFLLIWQNIITYLVWYWYLKLWDKAIIWNIGMFYYAVTHIYRQRLSHISWQTYTFMQIITFWIILFSKYISIYSTLDWRILKRTVLIWLPYMGC